MGYKSLAQTPARRNRPVSSNVRRLKHPLQRPAILKMPHYLNNCKNRDHRHHYGPDAFYDLDTSGVQAKKQFIFRPGDWCVVASEPKPGEIKFSWYKFTGSRLAKDKTEWEARVLCGTFEKEESMSKPEAALHKYYRPFFDKNGNFKQQSVI